jgi:hypothetical protein
LRVALWGIDTQEVPRAFVERLERCGVLDGQMAIVELTETVWKIAEGVLDRVR